MALTKASQIGKTLKNAGRLRTIVGVFARHGFHNVLEKVQLGKFLIERINPRPDLDNLSMPERLRSSFEELGPSFVKLGQVLATRPDLIPEEYVLEFERLHDRVAPLPFDVIEQVLREEFGPNYRDRFRMIDQTPLGSASIAQAHKAILNTGEEVVIKVQRPGIIQTINDDLNVLYFMAELLETYVPDTRLFDPSGVVNEYFKTLELETNFIVEANNIRRFQANFVMDPKVHVPKVFMELTTERILCLEALPGKPLSGWDQKEISEVDAPEILRIGLKAYLKMVFEDGLFHGDLHAGNFFILPDTRIGLIDFGVVGRLNPKTQASIANMLIALSKEDYERMAYEYVDLAPFTDQVNVDIFAKELRELIAPFFGLTLKNVNLGKVLMKSAGIAAKHRLQLPTELMLFFKSLVSIEGIGRRIQNDFDFLAYSLEFASQIAQTQYGPQRIANDMSIWARESRSLLNSLPRQVSFFLRKINSPDHAFKMNVPELRELKKSIESSSNLLFLAVVIGSLILSSSFIFVHSQDQTMAGMPTMAFVGYMLASILGIISFVNYIRKP